jgi:Flp pilus assembly protein TadB
VQSAPTARHAPERPTPLAMVEELIDLGAGVGIVFLPLLAISLPGVLLFFALPAVLLLVVTAVPAIVLGAVVVPPYLLARALLRRRASGRAERRVSR